MGLFAKWRSAWQELSLRKKGFIPPEEIQIPGTDSHYVVELRGTKIRNAKMYRDSKVVYAVHYNERSGSKSDIQFITSNGDRFDWGYSGYGAHDVKVTCSNGSLEMASKNSDMDHPYSSDDAPRLFDEFDREHAVFKNLIRSLPMIRISLPDEDAPKAAHNLGWRKIERSAAIAPIHG